MLGWSYKAPWGGRAGTYLVVAEKEHWGVCHVRRVGSPGRSQTELPCGPSTGKTITQPFSSEPVWRSLKWG